MKRVLLATLLMSACGMANASNPVPPIQGTEVSGSGSGTVLSEYELTASIEIPNSCGITISDYQNLDIVFNPSRQHHDIKKPENTAKIVTYVSGKNSYVNLWRSSSSFEGVDDVFDIGGTLYGKDREIQYGWVITESKGNTLSALNNTQAASTKLNTQSQYEIFPFISGASFFDFTATTINMRATLTAQCFTQS